MCIWLLYDQIRTNSKLKNRTEVIILTQSLASHIVNWCCEYGLNQLIDVPTRMVSDRNGVIISETCLDLCITRLPSSMVVKTKVLDLGISNHFCINYGFWQQKSRRVWPGKQTSDKTSEGSRLAI